ADGEMSRFDRAKLAAKQILGQLPPHSTVRVVTCADRVLDRFDEPVEDDRARQIIDGLKLTHLATDLYPGMVEAADLLRLCKATNKELYVFSDMQKLGWDRQPSALPDALRGIHEQALVNLVRCGSRTPHNVAIISLTPQVDM